MSLGRTFILWYMDLRQVYATPLLSELKRVEPGYSITSRKLKHSLVGQTSELFILCRIFKTDALTSFGVEYALIELLAHSAAWHFVITVTCVCFGCIAIYFKFFPLRRNRYMLVHNNTTNSNVRHMKYSLDNLCCQYCGTSKRESLI